MEYYFYRHLKTLQTTLWTVVGKPPQAFSKSTKLRPWGQLCTSLLSLRFVLCHDTVYWGFLHGKLTGGSNKNIFMYVFDVSVTTLLCELVSFKLLNSNTSSEWWSTKRSSPSGLVFSSYERRSLLLLTICDSYFYVNTVSCTWWTWVNLCPMAG